MVARPPDVPAKRPAPRVIAPMESLDDVCAALHPLLARHAGSLVMVADEPGNLQVQLSAVIDGALERYRADGLA